MALGATLADMQPGRRVGERFELQALAGVGGMGTVYRALDSATGAVIALKLLHEGADTARFAREARLLAGLEHPGIVAFVAHGLDAETGTSYTAMEWLEGEDLEARLARAGRLGPAGTTVLARRVADALAFAHQRGVVHRDLKPSNLFLVDGELERVKIVDFGIAFAGGPATRATRTGTAIGTPGYMAPEQTRGERSVGPRADVFSLGCVLFECLTGRPAFAGEHVIAILAKILFEDAPRVAEIASDVPAALDALVARMLAKDLAARPADGGAIARALESLAATHSAVGPSGAALVDAACTTGDAACELNALSGAEQRLVSVVMLAAEPVPAGGTTVAADDADATRSLESVVRAMRALEAHAEQLFDGTIVLTLPGSGAATDQAARAALCALAVHAAAPDAPVALSTGRERNSDGRGRAIGEAIDRAARLVRSVRPSTAGVRIDAVTAGLLDERFERLEDGVGTVLLGQREVDAARTLLGKPTPCVGRDGELAALEALIAQCAEEPIARAAVVTAAAGVGKSRLRHELLRKLRARPERIEIWMARGDPVGAGGAWGLGAQLVRRAAGILDGEPIEKRRDKLRARVGRFVASAQAARVADYLGEMIGTPFPEDGNVQLLAARTDAILMGDQIRRAWEDLVDAETAAHALLIVLEDLHWGDLPTVALVDAALRLFPDRPLMVLALARPEVDQTFRGLWKERHAQRIVLAPLPRGAGERLVRSVLGPGAPAERVARLVEQAAGNAFYLEELIRFEAEGGGDALPETVLAMVEARLAALEPETRRLLRAASVFGQVFWAAGVVKLLGGAELQADTEHRLDDLVRREMVTRRRPASRLAGETEYAFRHSVVREAAHAMLTGPDRALGHRLAATWLEAVGENDAMVLAEHLERGEQPARAARAFVRAAEQALEGNDFAGAIARVERGVSVGAQGDVLGDLRRIQAEAHVWRGENADAVRAAFEAVALLPRSSDAWGDAAGHLAGVSSRLGDIARLAATAEKLLELVRARRPSAGCLRAAARTAAHLLLVGRPDAAETLLAAVEVAVGPAPDDPSVRARLQRARSTQALHAGDPARYLELFRAAAASFDQAGDARSACLTQTSVGFGLLEVGAFAEAETPLRSALASAHRMGLSYVAAAVKQNLGWALARQGRLDEAVGIESDSVQAFHAQGDRRMEGGSRNYLAAILFTTGDVAAAEAEARAAVALLAAVPPLRPYALATLARILVHVGRARDALDSAREAMAAVDAGGAEEGEGLIRLVYAEVLDAAGDRDDEARRAIGVARESLLARAAKISDELWRRSFLENVPEHARTLGIAAAWLDAPR